MCLGKRVASRTPLSTDLQGIDKLPVLLAGKEQGGDARIRELQHGISELGGRPGWPVAEENGHLPHEEAAPYSLERVSGHEGHGGLQTGLLPRQRHLQVVNVLQEGRLLPGVGEADLRGHLVVVADHGHTGAPWTVAFSDGQVAHDTQQHVSHPLKRIVGDTL